MAAPPILRVLDLGKNEIIFRRIEQAAFDQRHAGAGAENKCIEVAHAGFAFGDHAIGDLRPGGGKNLHLETETRLKRRLELAPQLRARRQPDDDLAFLLRRRNRFVPLGLPWLLRI